MLTDSELLRQINKGSLDALEQVMRRYDKQVYGFALKIVRNPELAEEIAQDIFLKTWEKRATLPNIESLPAWLFLLTKNQSLNILKEINRRHVHETNFASQLDLLIDGDGEIHFKEMKQFLAKIIDELSPRRQLIYRMKAEQGLSTEEIAAQLNLSPSTVRNQLAKTYQTIRDLMAGHLHLLAFLPAVASLFIK